PDRLLPVEQRSLFRHVLGVRDQLTADVALAGEPTDELQRGSERAVRAVISRDLEPREVETLGHRTDDNKAVEGIRMLRICHARQVGANRAPRGTVQNRRHGRSLLGVDPNEVEGVSLRVGTYEQPALGVAVLWRTQARHSLSCERFVTVA